MYCGEPRRESRLFLPIVARRKDDEIAFYDLRM